MDDETQLRILAVVDEEDFEGVRSFAEYCVAAPTKKKINKQNCD